MKKLIYCKNIALDAEIFARDVERKKLKLRLKFKNDVRAK